ncbi:Response regulator of zinc sigma-54-dependent two-component system [Labilithrix luteola]|uniref:Response regulator of zinc sigma-54-dependent two-component system n=1 Tax=Labilithrix luteola TaxID=1391654 RepID=A0A0K1PYA8_9BACT|nr:sigma 54-interacting transcriptional regulator [Labilithrix luteola]AKU98492.1 Response regulator of zinc sigma-54-dependent two-component system [Labilithrix luteola]
MNSDEQKTDSVRPLAPSGRRLVASLDGKLVFIDLPSRGRLVLGRGSYADIVLDHSSISRRHLAIDLSEQSVTIEDLGSANGTSLAGKKLGKGVPGAFPAGAALEVGSVLLTLQDARAMAVASMASEEAVVEDPAMREAHETVRVAAGSSLSVLLLGETGVGKELFARRIHDLSPRRDQSLIRVNCAALVESLLEAELFGYERGAFTGATQAKPGLLEAASGGTLFFDEVGELPLPTQAKLLRVLESGEVTRVGALRPRKVDVRFVSATHRELRARVASGAFREDLFFRLDGVSIRIPPLRDRASEILPLAQRFIAIASAAANRPAPSLSDAAMAALVAHTWSGNVRELKNVIQRSVLFCKTPRLEASDLRFDAMVSAGGGGGAPTVAASTARAGGAEIEGLSPERLARRQRVLEALESTLHNQTRAAELLGISRRTLQSWMIDLRIPRPRTASR